MCNKGDEKEQSGMQTNTETKTRQINTSNTEKDGSKDRKWEKENNW